jgi:VanZ family protein
MFRYYGYFCNMKTIIKRYPLSLIVIAAILFLSLFNPPKTKLDPITYIDKIAHICMYGGLELIIWFEYLRSHPNIDLRKISIWALAAPIALGGLMEMAQMYLTSNRSGEWADLAADSIGVVLGAVVGFTLLKRWVHCKKQEF